MRYVLLILLLTACGSDEPTLTRGEVCDELAATLCAERLDCGDISNVEACEEAELADCCGTLCHLETEVTRAVMDTCTADIQSAMCDVATAPASCPSFE